MTQDEEMKSLQNRNRRTGLIVAAIAFGIFLSIIIRTWYLRDGG